MKLINYSRPGIRHLVLLTAVLALVFTGLVPQLYSKFEIVQAAVGELPSVPVPARMYFPMEEPAELPSAKLYLPMGEQAELLSASLYLQMELLAELPSLSLYLPMVEPAKLPATAAAAAIPAQPPEKIRDTIPEESPPAVSDAQPVSMKCAAVECKYYALVVKASKRHQVEPALVAAIIKAESGYNPRAVSKRGAKGLMQLMPPTAAELGVENSFDPEHNIDGGVRYYKKLLKRYDGNIELALAAYNAGMQSVKKYNGVPPFKATRHYIKKVLHYYRIYQETLIAVETPDPHIS